MVITYPPIQMILRKQNDVKLSKQDEKTLLPWMCFDANDGLEILVKSHHLQTGGCGIYDGYKTGH